MNPTEFESALRAVRQMLDDREQVPVWLSQIHHYVNGTARSCPFHHNDCSSPVGTGAGRPADVDERLRSDNHRSPAVAVLAYMRLETTLGGVMRER